MKPFKCTPKGLYFHRLQMSTVSQDGEVYTNFMYLSTDKKRLEFENIMDNPDIVSSISFYTDEETDEARVGAISTNKEHRGRGHAYYLFLQAMLYLKSVGIVTVTLDDDSDNYRSANNLYLKLGFEYLSEDAGPEMFAEISNILTKQHFEYFKQRWGQYYTC